MKPELKLIPKDGPVFRVRDARGILEEAINEDYETVIVFGFKDGEIHTRHSASKDCLEIIGALDRAKDEFWERR